MGRLVAGILAKDGNILHCVDINKELNQQIQEEYQVRLVYNFQASIIFLVFQEPLLRLPNKIKIEIV